MHRKHSFSGFRNSTYKNLKKGVDKPQKWCYSYLAVAKKQKATKNKIKKLLTKHLNCDSINELSLMRKQQREL